MDTHMAVRELNKGLEGTPQLLIAVACKGIWAGTLGGS